MIDPEMFQMIVNAMTAGDFCDDGSAATRLVEQVVRLQAERVAAIPIYEGTDMPDLIARESVLFALGITPAR